MLRRSISLMLAGSLTAIPAAIFVDMLVHLTGGRFTLAHFVLLSTATTGGLWLREDLSNQQP